MRFLILIVCLLLQLGLHAMEENEAGQTLADLASQQSTSSSSLEMDTISVDTEESPLVPTRPHPAQVFYDIDLKTALCGEHIACDAGTRKTLSGGAACGGMSALPAGTAVALVGSALGSTVTAIVGVALIAGGCCLIVGGACEPKAEALCTKCCKKMKKDCCKKTKTMTRD